MHLQDNPYIQQYMRVKRWYRRFEQITKDRTHDMTSENYQDDVYAFFISCYHLKDWIANDHDSGITKSAVEEFVRQSVNLSICGDFCNGIKHFAITNPKFNKDVRVARRHFSLSLGGGPLINVKYEINVGGESVDAFELATRCLHEWEAFLDSHNPEFALNRKLGTI